MSRLHSTQQKSDLFETYLSTMLKNGKRVERPRNNDICRTTRDREKSVNRNNNTNNQLVVSRPVKIIQKNEEVRAKPSTEELLHKEVYNNNMATVEVTVRTVAPKGANTDSKSMSEDKREPWGKLLTNRKSDDNIPGTFGNFDPLRTLHFLSQELQLKLQTVCPGDPNLQQIVNDMQNAIHRLPPDVISQFQFFGTSNAGDAEMPPTKKKSNKNIDISEKETQTVIIGDAETKKMQQQLEDSALKLEASCKEMEELCVKLRVERDDLQSMLVFERETVITLRQELKDAVAKKDEKFNKEISKLANERDELLEKIQTMQNNLDLQVTQSTGDLRALIDGLKSKQLATEQENTTIKKELTIMKLEKDKMNVLLECRDRQLKELRNELECIQQLVTTQLLDVKAKPAYSTTSTVSSTSGIWNMAPSRTQNYGKSVHELFMNNDIMRKMLLDNELKVCDSAATSTLVGEETGISNMKLKLEDIQVIPQKENPPTLSQMTISDAGVSTDDFLKSNHPSIKDMFAEIKRQAFMKIDAPLSNVSRTTQNDSKVNIPNDTLSVSESRASESS